jgi:hypothetical protein
VERERNRMPIAPKSKAPRSKTPLTADSERKVDRAIKYGLTCAQINEKELAIHTDGSVGLSRTGYNHRARKLGVKAKASEVRHKASTLTTPDTPEVVYRDLETGKYLESANDITLGMTFAEYRLNRKGSATLQLVYSREGGAR